MSVVRVSTKWVNPDKVIWIGVRHTAYHGQDEEWFATVRCDEGQGWDWKCENEEAADQKCDELAMQVNGGPKFAVARQPKDIPYEETLR